MGYSYSEVEGALEKVRELLRPDGGDICLLDDSGRDVGGDGATDSGVTDNGADGGSLGQFDGETLRLRLVVENSDCPECILPKEMLEPIALDILSAELPGLTSVSISDPRLLEESPPSPQLPDQQLSDQQEPSQQPTSSIAARLS